MKAIANACRIILGILFVFSGFVKIIDPIGTSYKFTDYFVAMGIPSLSAISLVLSFVMCVAEFVTGLSLLLNVKTKIGFWSATLLMLIFTPITLWLAITDKVSDCGCFGDAIKLSNWGTFWKNIIIDLILVLLAITFENVQALFNKKAENWVFVALIMGTFGFEYYNYMHLPIIDFMPYKVGTNISEKMKPTPDSVTVKLVYEKNGERKEFTIENFPQDASWKFIEQKQTLIRKGEHAPIHDFSIRTLRGEIKDSTNLIMVYEKNGEKKEFSPENAPTTDTLWKLIEEKHIVREREITNLVLKDPNFSMLFIAHNLKKSNVEAMKAANETALFFQTKGAKFYALTASSNADVQRFKAANNLQYTFYTTDETTLKTMLRANPGYILLKDGVIVGKWHYTDQPSVEELTKKFFSKEEKKNSKKKVSI